MRCLPFVTLDSDKPYWIKRESFLAFFDHTDFMCREVSDVSPSYLSAWFHEQPNNLPFFYLPTVTFVSGKTQFINGRHRTAVLLPHLSELPMAFHLSILGSNALLAQLDKRPLNLEEVIMLPRLPIAEHLP